MTKSTLLALALCLAPAAAFAEAPTIGTVRAYVTPRNSGAYQQLASQASSLSSRLSSYNARVSAFNTGGRTDAWTHRSLVSEHRSLASEVSRYNAAARAFGYANPVYGRR